MRRVASGVRAASAAAILVLSVCGSTLAVDYIWQGAGTGGNTATDPVDPTTQWNQTANWVGGIPPDYTTITFPFANAGNAYASDFNANTVKVDGASADGALVVGSDVIALWSGSLYVGHSARGRLVQSGGTSLSGAGDIYLGYNAPSEGVYEMQAGSLTVPKFYVGYLGTGTFIQSGGTVSAYRTASTASYQPLYVGYQSGSAGTYQLSGGTVRASTTRIASEYTGATGLFVQTGGEHFTGTMPLGVGARYELHDGVLSAGDMTIAAGGAFEQTGGTLLATCNLSGGTIEGVLRNSGAFNYNSGTMTGGLVNLGTASINSSLQLSAGVENYSSFTLGAGIDLTANGTGLFNAGTLTLNGGVLDGTAVVNDYTGQLNAKGRIAVDWANNGSLSLTGLLDLDGATANSGVINVPSAKTLRTAGEITNNSWIGLAGGSISGTGSLLNTFGGTVKGYGAVTVPVTNDGGLIYAVNSATALTISDLSGGNVNGGQMIVDDGARLTVATAFASSGQITLDGSAARLAGGEIANTGSISGRGTIANAIQNAGVIRAESGQLTLSAAGVASAATGRIEAPAGTTVFFTQGLAGNAGIIALTGGTLDNNARDLTNAAGGQIVGSGVIRAATLTNQGTVRFGAGNVDVHAAVVNAGFLEAQANTTTFYGPVTNSPGGTIKNTGSVIRYLGGDFNNGGTYVSDPADNYFVNVANAETGAFVGGVGDRFIISGDFLSASTQAAAWNTAGAELVFRAGLDGAHTLSVTGADLGPAAAGWADNFAWGKLTVEAGQKVVLADGNAAAGGALYIGELTLAGVGSCLSAPAGLSVFYANDGTIKKLFSGDANLNGSVDLSDLSLLAANYRQAGRAWSEGDFNGDGKVDLSDLSLLAANYRNSTGLAPGVPVPEPGTLALLALGALMALRRRKGD